MARKSVPRDKQHEWHDPGSGALLACTKCRRTASTSEIRSGIGECPGSVPDDPGPLIPEGATPVYRDDQLIGYVSVGETDVSYLDGQTPKIDGGGPRRVDSICDTCGFTRPECGNDPATVRRAINDDILECTDWQNSSQTPPPPQAPEPKPLPVVISQPGPNYIKPEENCNACHGRLAIIPINTRMSMVACPNRGCDLWRERLRWYPRQDRNPRRRRASRAAND